MYTKEEKKWISDLNFGGKKRDQKCMQMATYLLSLDTS
jgi:hypothetical protein